MPPNRVLVIDDDPFVTRIVEICLAKLGGLSVQYAPSGAIGLLQAEAQAPDLILLDYDMPGLDGLETLTQLRARGNHAPVVAITGAYHLSPRCSEMIAQCDGYLPKPFNFRQLTELVASFLNLAAVALPAEPRLA